MKSPFTLASLLAALLFSLVVSNTILPFPDPEADTTNFRFEARLTSTSAGTVQVYYQKTGGQFTEADSVKQPIAAGSEPVLLSFRLSAEGIQGLRIDPVSRESILTVTDALIRRPNGSVYKRFLPENFVPINEIAHTSIQGGTLTIATTPAALDPHVAIDLGTPDLPLIRSVSEIITPFIWRALPIFLVIATILAWLARLGSESRARWLDRVGAVRAWIVARPKTTVACIALLAAVASSWPVLFAGRSYVSPSYGSTLLYDTLPTLPGFESKETFDVRGSDIGAIIWQHVPLAALQSRALFRDHELPLWNRYNSAGTVLLGQGQTMFGDPLHFGVILAGSASWAWDLKYIAAKFLLGLGTGLIVLHAARHLPSALLIAFSSVFVGFFLFRLNHPAFFSFCYGPWILYAWCLITAATGRRALFLALLFLMLANWAMMNSGTAKEAYLSLLTLNACGALVLLLAESSLRERLRRLLMAAAAGGLFLLISAPVWLTFYNALKSSSSSYAAPFASQVQPGVLIGFFDELLLRPFMEAETVYNPSSNFLILAGVIAFLVNLRAIVTNRYALAFGLAMILPLSFTFGLVPPLLIAKLPFLANVHHIDNCFGLGVIHLSAVLAGFGFAGAARRLGQPEGRGDLWIGLLMLLGLLATYFATTQTVQRTSANFWEWGQYLQRSWFVWGTTASLFAALVGLALSLRHMATRRLVSAAALIVACTCLLVLLWRFGLQLRSQFPNYAATAGPRASLTASSPALEKIRADAREPGRVLGFGGNLFPGWNNMYDIESINGPDALKNRHLEELQKAVAIERIWDWRLIIFPETLLSARPFLDMLNVRHYLDYRGDRAKVSTLLTPVAFEDLDVYRSDTAWPRAFFTNRVASYREPKDFVDLLNREAARPFAAVQAGDTMPASLPAGNPQERTVVPATNYRLTTNTTSFTVDAPSAGVIVLTEAWLKRDFIALLNDKPVPYFRFNHAFKGISIPQAGTYHVSFRYQPRDFTLSLIFCALGLGLTTVVGVWVFRSTRAAPAIDAGKPAPDA